MNGIVIQGPTNYYKELSYHYSVFDNVVWSTWDDEPLENIQHITSQGIKVITSPIPKTPGPQNVNLQLASSLAGVEYLKNQGFTHALKIRSDVIWEGVELIWDRLIDQKIGFLSLNTPSFKRSLNYFLDYWHDGFDFTTDHVIFGEIDILSQTFSPPNFSYSENTPPESIILANYLKSQNKPTDFSLENLKSSGVYLFAEDCKEFNNKIIWLKHNWNLISLTFNPWENFITKL